MKALSQIRRGYQRRIQLRQFSTTAPHSSQHQYSIKVPIQPYFSINHFVKEIKSEFEKKDLTSDHFKQLQIRAGGRIIGRRKASKDLIFLDLQSNGETIQIMIEHKILQEFIEKSSNQYSFKDLAESFHRGAIVGIEGYPGRTQAGEFTLIAKEVHLLAACKQVLPMMNWEHKKTLKDHEVRFQKRHLDLIANNDLKKFFFTRTRIINYLRNFLDKRGFLEVETPILNSQAGGALAKPFETESKLLHQKLELRVAPELFLKKLIIGGFDRVYEIGKVFRNEGIDSTHNPEFTSLEFYQAYSDYRDLIVMAEEILSGLSKELYGSAKVIIPQFDMDQKLFTRGEKAGELAGEQKCLELDFGGKYQQYNVCQELGIDPTLFEEKHYQTLRENLLQMVSEIGHSKKDKPLIADQLNEKQLIDKLIEHHIEERCINPSFIINHPMIMSPLAKSLRQGREGHKYQEYGHHIAERFELFINKKEVINAYSEQNDSDLQRQGFLHQTSQSQSGPSNDEELHRSDEDFIDALSYGMPPTGGFGIGIDRLCMIMSGVSQIREIILFPMFRTSVLQATNKSKTQKK